MIIVSVFQPKREMFYYLRQNLVEFLTVKKSSSSCSNGVLGEFFQNKRGEEGNTNPKLQICFTSSFSPQQTQKSLFCNQFVMYLCNQDVNSFPLWEYMIPVLKV